MYFGGIFKNLINVLNKKIRNICLKAKDFAFFIFATQQKKNLKANLNIYEYIRLLYCIYNYIQL